MTTENLYITYIAIDSDEYEHEYDIDDYNNNSHKINSEILYAGASWDAALERCMKELYEALVVETDIVPFDLPTEIVITDVSTKYPIEQQKLNFFLTWLPDYEDERIALANDPKISYLDIHKAINKYIRFTKLQHPRKVYKHNDIYFDSVYKNYFLIDKTLAELFECSVSIPSHTNKITSYYSNVFNFSFVGCRYEPSSIMENIDVDILPVVDARTLPLNIHSEDKLKNIMMCDTNICHLHEYIPFESLHMEIDRLNIFIKKVNK